MFIISIHKNFFLILKKKKRNRKDFSFLFEKNTYKKNEEKEIIFN